MTTKQCINCKASIPKYKATCPFCRTKQGQVTGKTIFIGFIFLILLAAIFNSSGQMGTAPN